MHFTFRIQSNSSASSGDPSSQPSTSSSSEKKKKNRQNKQAQPQNDVAKSADVSNTFYYTTYLLIFCEVCDIIEM